MDFIIFIQATLLIFKRYNCKHHLTKSIGMKRILLTALVLLVSTLGVLATPRMILEDKKENYVQSETGYTLHFKLKASSSEMTEIAQNISNLSSKLTMTMAESTDEIHDCVLTINHQNQPEYVHKMLLSIGIGEIEYKGNVKSLDSIIEILYSYL